MEDTNVETQGENKIETPEIKEKSSNNQQQIAGAIIIAGIFIAGAILLKGNAPVPSVAPGTNGATPTTVTISPVSQQDRILGNPDAKLTLVIYEDFQCPFCGRFFKDSEQSIRENYVNKGLVQIVYRDYAFLGPESVKSAEAARCAGDQGKFWEYHDYLFTHQNGENQGGFADPNLKSFAGTLGLDTKTFNQCLDGGKYAKAVSDSTTEGGNDGVRGTPKGFILKKGKIVDTIDGAIPNALVTSKIEAALK